MEEVFKFSAIIRFRIFMSFFEPLNIRNVIKVYETKSIELKNQ